MKLYVSALNSSRRTRNGTSKCGILKLALLGIYISWGVLMTVGLVLHICVLLSPEIRQRILKNVLHCEQSNEYFQLRSSATNHALDNNHSRASAEDQQRELEPTSETVDMAKVCTSCKGMMSDTKLSLQTSSSSCNGASKQQSSLANSTSTPSAKKLRVLIGIVTPAWKADRRHILRLAYGVQQLSSSEDTEFTVRFILGNLKKDRDRILVGMENATYGDMILLACEENINHGKTFNYFSSLPTLGVVYDYVMKTDDDSYVRLENLGKHLKPLPREDLYYGYNLPCTSNNAYSSFLAGAGYLISWDLVLWIKDSPIPRNHAIGVEDKLVGDWFNEGSRAKNRATNKGLFYDHPDFGGVCAHVLTMDTVLVHQVKTPERWLQVLDFFEKDRISLSLSNALKLDSADQRDRSSFRSTAKVVLASGR